MKIIKPSTDFLPMPTDKLSLLKHLERCGRVCYKSEDKITEGSAEKFIAGIIKRGHEAVLEHGAIILQISYADWLRMVCRIKDLGSNTDYRSFLNFTCDNGRPVVSGNVRAWRDFLKADYAWYNKSFRFLSYITQKKYPELFPEFQDAERFKLGTSNDSLTFELQIDDLITENEKLHHQYQTLLFTCDRGVSHELVRHRPSSFCQESTRYCNYSKEGFGGEITVIEPLFFDPNTPVYRMWKRACEATEVAYFDLLNEGCSPQQARAVLPNSLKTELMMTASMSEWRHVVKLRCAPTAHPQAREVMNLGLALLHMNIPTMFEDLKEEFLGGK